MKKIALILTFTIALINLKAQDSFSEKFLEANTLMEEKQYNIALPIWLKLNSENTDNGNVNYKTGICYLNSANHKKQALPFLRKASEKISKNYAPFSSSEKNAPVETYLYLAKAYHVSSEIDSATTFYNKFKNNVSEKHYLFNEVDHYLKQCENAKAAMANPVNVKVTNMGNVINGNYSDFSPVLSVDESTIYFTSRRIREDSSNLYTKDIFDGQHFEDIYVSENYDGVWSKPELININTAGHDAVVNISTDGQTLFVYRDDAGNGNIYTSTLEDDQWSELVSLGSDINEKSRETHAHITPDGSLLYFVSDRKGGIGGQDIYVCKKLPNGEWAKAQNVGESINTPYDEDGIFIHPDGKTMYFSSNGHSSIGGYDIFSSTIDESGFWSTPENLGYPVNSTDNDVFFVTSADGKRGYYSSFNEKGYGEKDIYRISLEDANAKPVTLLTGFIKVIGKPECAQNALVTVSDKSSGDIIGEYRPRRKDCKFSIILTPGKDYHVVYAADKYTQEEDIFIPTASAYQEIQRGIDLEDVIFGVDGEKMVNSSRSRLDQLKQGITDLEGLKTKDIDWYKKNNIELSKLKASLASLDHLKDEEWNNDYQNQLNQNQIKFDKLKASATHLDDIHSEDVNLMTELKGTIKDANQKSMSGVIIDLYNEYHAKIKSETSDNEGAFKFNVERNKEYTVIARKPGYNNSDKSIKKLQILNQVVFEIELMLEEDAKASLLALVTDKLTKKPLEGVTIKVLDTKTKKKSTFITSNTGSYVYSLNDKNIPETVSVNFVLEKKGYKSKDLPYSVLLDLPNQFNVNSSLDLAMEPITADKEESSNKIVSQYQEFFDYNIKDINTTDTKYIEMIDKAIEKSKSTGTVKIAFESSASRVPTKTHKTNTSLAFKRANAAKEKVIASLVAKGIAKDKIIILNINSKVRGPKYNGDYKNTSVYKKYQYVIIRVQ